MLTPEKIEAMNQVTGWTTPVSTSPVAKAGNDRAQEIIKLGRNAAPIADNVGSRVAGEWKGAGDKIMSSVTEGANKFASEPTDMGGTIARTGDLLKTGLGVAAGGVRGVVAPFTAVLGAAMDKTGYNFYDNLDPDEKKTIDTLKEWVSAHPEAAETLGDIATVATSGLGEGAVGTMLGADIVPALKQGTETVLGAAAKVPKIIGATARFAKNPDGTINNVLEDAKLALSKGNMEPRVGVSAERLQQAAPMGGAGAATKPSLRDLYDDFYKQEENFKVDAKADTALNTVGERIGDAYDKVIAMRRNVGQKMGDELKKVGDIQTDASGASLKFDEELTGNGVIKNEDGLAQSRTSKVTDSDLSLLSDYKTRLDALGPNPTVAELDAFLSRVPKEIDVYKATNNITDVTNGERIITNNLNELRASLDPAKNPALKGYAEARSAYSDLSNFLDEGSSHLGKKTQSGDYAKDASLAKGSVQSVLGGGKKDWLIELENLTGYPAIDESVLALQAMKDAGNFRGLSLLETLSDGASSVIEGGKPTWRKVLDATVSAGKKKLIGSPADQTRRILDEFRSDQ